MQSIINAILGGMATLLAALHDQIVYAGLQTRLATMTDGFLDLFAFDFFGSTLRRRAGQGDDGFRTRIQASLFVIRNSRPAMVQALTRLTGRAPTIIEPWNTGDTMGLDAGLYLDGPGYLGASVSENPYQSFVIAYRPLTIGNTDLGYLDDPTSGPDAGLFLAPDNNNTVSDEDIFAVVESMRMAGTVVWLNIGGSNQAAMTDDAGILDFSIAGNDLLASAG